MDLFHWHYFLGIENDIESLARYVEFAPSNFSTYSVELARILMAATQELDVVLKQLCARHGDSSDSEAGYRAFLPTKYPKLLAIEVALFRGELKFTPFSSWSSGTTPVWWTANNKVKHQRHTHYGRASLEAALSAACGLFLANLYFYDGRPKDQPLYPATKLFYPEGCVESVTPTIVGVIPNYKLS